MFIAGQNRKVITFEEEGLFMNFQWIEGIGNISGFSLMWEQIDVTAGSLLVCFTQNDQTTFFNGATSCDNTTLSQQHFNKQNFVLSPNPVKQTSQILLPPNSKGYSIKIFDLNGKVLNESHNQKDTFTINATDFVTGVYFYQVFEDTRHLKAERFLVK
ncbi:MAG: T9SS type A sorting domain-containing protein [Flavobacteriaceae bacterium]|nr:T9SS type A sorting domain-containing protein [Flavobacteriaceae bacterium]